MSPKSFFFNVHMIRFVSPISILVTVHGWAQTNEQNLDLLLFFSPKIRAQTGFSHCSLIDDLSPFIVDSLWSVHKELSRFKSDVSILFSSSIRYSWFDRSMINQFHSDIYLRQAWCIDFVSSWFCFYWSVIHRIFLEFLSSLES